MAVYSMLRLESNIKAAAVEHGRLLAQIGRHPTRWVIQWPQESRSRNLELAVRSRLGLTSSNFSMLVDF